MFDSSFSLSIFFLFLIVYLTSVNGRAFLGFIIIIFYLMPSNVRYWLGFKGNSRAVCIYVMQFIRCFYGVHHLSHLHISIYTCTYYTCFFFTGMLFLCGVELVLTLYTERVRGVEQLHRERRSQKKKKGI